LATDLQFILSRAKIEPVKILTVSELTAAIKSVLEPAFRGLSVKGEISNFKQQSSGHLYFSLKDAGAQISAVLFRGSAAQLSRMPKEGDQVVAVGEMSLYAPRGQYQIIVRELQFLGLGELLMKFHQLKTTLQGRGWFDADKKKPLPKFPRRIGVVTSPTGAVIRDILNVLKRRFPNFNLILNPVRVQGDQAPREIAEAIELFNRKNLADVLIVARGGGSIEDLWAFNEEIVAKAIFDSKIPIISAVGHETDFTIADWVADVRAPTPSAAAEIVVAEQAQLLQTLGAARAMNRRSMQSRMEQLKRRMNDLKTHSSIRFPMSILAKPIQQLDFVRSSLNAAKPENQIKQFRTRFAPYQARFTQAMRLGIRQKKEKLVRLWEHLQSLNPDNVLQKGYAILFLEKDSSIILSAKNLEIDQPLLARLHDGQVRAVVKTVEIK
jgi:exodeoxyribonuclease VII large subunit